jgi:hypothetical protein
VCTGITHVSPEGFPETVVTYLKIGEFVAYSLTLYHSTGLGSVGRIGMTKGRKLSNRDILPEVPTANEENKEEDQLG